MAIHSNGKYAKRIVRRIYVKMDKVMAQLLEVKGMFQGPHPDYAETLDLIARLVLAAQDNLTTFYEAAWGKEPANWFIDSGRKN